MILNEREKQFVYGQCARVPAAVLEAGNSEVSTINRIPGPVELIFRERVKDIQCMMVIRTTEKKIRQIRETGYGRDGW